MSYPAEKPDISIVLPTYNVGSYIDRCLESCVNQTHENIEIIIVDDCGNDDSIQKAQLWAEKDSRIKIIHNPRNLGTYHARRRGVEVSKGEYVIFLDPDDALDHSAAHEIFSATCASSPDIIFFGIIELKKNNSGVLKIKKQNAPLLNTGLKKYFTRNRVTHLGTPGKAYKTAMLYDVFSEAAIPEVERLVYGEDVLILFLVLRASLRGLSINKELYYYYINENSITTQKSIGDVRFQQQQLDQVIAHLNKLIFKKNNKVNNLNRDIIRRFSAKLSSDKHLLARHTPDEFGQNKYFESILFAFFELPTLKDLIRIFFYIVSIGNIRI